MPTHAQLRPVVLEYLKTYPEGQLILTQDTFFRSRCKALGMSYSELDDVLVQEIFHELYLERVIVSGNGPRYTVGGMNWPFYRLTSYGKQVASATEYVPHDPDGYLARIKREIPAVDQTILLYLEQSLGCFRAGHLLAAAVMIGCSAEKALLLLVDAFCQALNDPDEKAKYEKETASWIISKKYEALWKRLEKKQGSVPEALRDDLHVMLDRSFDLIRTVRNDAGHPTGKKLDADAVSASFILFPGYCRRIYGLIEHFKVNPA